MANITAPGTPAPKVGVPATPTDYKSEADTIVEAITAACSECCLFRQVSERVLAIAGHIREITSRNNVNYKTRPTVHAVPRVFHVYIYIYISIYSIHFHSRRIEMGCHFRAYVQSTQICMHIVRVHVHVYVYVYASTAAASSLQTSSWGPCLRWCVGVTSLCLVVPGSDTKRPAVSNRFSST